MRKKWLTKKLLAAALAGILAMGPLGLSGIAVSAQEETSELTESPEDKEALEDAETKEPKEDVASDEASEEAGNIEEDEKELLTAEEEKTETAEEEKTETTEEEKNETAEEASEGSATEEKTVLQGSDAAPTAPVTADVQGNKLTADKWDFWTGEGGAGSLDTADGPSKVTVTAEGWQTYAVQYTQMLNLLEGSTYRLTGDFYCEDDAVVFLNLQESLGWSSIMPDDAQKLELKAGEVYHLDITTGAASANFVANGKLALMFGSGSGNTGKTIQISNMALVNTNPDAEGEVTEPVEEEPDVNAKENLINFEDYDIELYVGSDWAGANATHKENGTKATVTAQSFGYNGEWGLQYMIKNLGFKDNNKYTLSFDITSTVDKKFFLKMDDAAGYIAETVEIKAGEKYHYEKTVSCGGFSAKPYVFFALGQMSGEEANRSGEVTIENMVIKGDLKAPEPVTPPTTDKGPEYDFTKDNSAYDFADPGTSKDGYTLVWADEFDGNYSGANVDSSTGLNLDNWAYQKGDGTTDCGNPGWGNAELQCYTGNSTNVGVNEDFTGDGQGEGVLRITANYEDGGYNYAGESTKNYTSARLRTTAGERALFNTTYGYVEARISLPNTKGAWPAFWMLPESTEVYGNWPTSGEIDIMETVGARSQEACGTLHWGAPEHVYKGSGYVDLFSPTMYFHTYAIDWKPGEITWYYDGQPINTLNNWEGKLPGHSDSLHFDAPFDMPFYMILNLAVDSGRFGGDANVAHFQDDINMYVDYVRVFHKDEGYDYEAVRGAGAGAKDDFANYAGINQIAPITEASLDGTGGGLDDDASDMSKWYLSYQNDATDARLSCVKDADGTEWAKVTIGAPGAMDYSVQLIGHYNAMKGYAYKVSFDAYADGGMKGKTVNCDSKEYKGWSTYGISSFDLAGEPTHYSYSFVQSEDFDNCRIEFNLGSRGSGNVYISNVKVEIIDPAELGIEKETRTPLADGNLIYNGTFDEGTQRIGYWTAADGTNITVPKYTLEKIDDSDIPVVDKATNTVKYYNRRALIKADEGYAPTIYQSGLNLPKDTYTVELDMYSATDSGVKAAVYSTKLVEDAPADALVLTSAEDGLKLVLDKELGCAAASYKEGDGLRRYTLVFDTIEDAENAAVVLSFTKGTEVLADNIYMHGANQASTVDEHPLKADAEYVGNVTGNGNFGEVILNNGTVTMTNITSGGSEWYAPQLASEDFAVVAGMKYKLSFKYKLTGNSNNTFKYIVQENGGGWAVALDIQEVTFDPANVDEDGFATYEIIFVSGTTVPNAHLNFGFGNSGATGNMNFIFKDAVIDLVQGAAAGTGNTSDNEDGIDMTQFENDAASGNEGGETPQPGDDEGGETPTPQPGEGGNEQPGSDEGTETPKPGNSGNGNNGNHGNKGNHGKGSDNSGSGSDNSGNSDSGNSGSANNGNSGYANAVQNPNSNAAQHAAPAAVENSKKASTGRGKQSSEKSSKAATTTETKETENKETQAEETKEETKEEIVLVAEAEPEAEKAAPAEEKAAETSENTEKTQIEDAATPLADKPAGGLLSDVLIYVIIGIAVAGSAAAAIAYTTIFRKRS